MLRFRRYPVAVTITSTSSSEPSSNTTVLPRAAVGTGLNSNFPALAMPAYGNRVSDSDATNGFASGTAHAGILS